MELGKIAEQAVDAALSAGAGDAEAYVAGLGRARDPRLRRRGREPDRGGRARGWGCAPGSTTASATRTAPTSSDEGLEAIAARRGRGGADRRPRRVRRAARAADGAAARRRSRGSPTRRSPSGRPSARSSSRRRSSAAAREADDRVERGGDHRLRRRGGAGRARLLHRPRRRASRRPPPTPTSRRSPTPTATSRPASASAWAARPRPSTPRRSAARRAERAVSLLGAAKPASRTCPVVLDPTVAASFVGFIGGTLCADAVQRGRSPFAGRLGEAVASAALTLTDDAHRPRRASTHRRSTPRARPAARTPLIEAGTLAAYLHDSYTARRQGDGTRTTASASRAGYRSPPSVSTSNLIVAPGDAELRRAPAPRPSDGVYVTDVAGLHSGVNPVSGTFSVGATGRLIAGGELAAPADEFTIASDLPVDARRRSPPPAREARWVPFGGSVTTPRAPDRRDGGRGLIGGLPAGHGARSRTRLIRFKVSRPPRRHRDPREGK